MISLPPQLDHPRFNVVVTYQNPTLADGLTATVEGLFSQSDSDWHIRWDLWRFDVLELPEVWGDIDHAAAHSNLLAVCLHQNSGLTNGLKRMLRMWGENCVPGTSALAAYSDSEPTACPLVAASLEYLRDLASDAGQLFLGTGRFQRSPGEDPRSPLARFQAGGRHCEFWESWIRVQPASHWGLNE